MKHLFDKTSFSCSKLVTTSYSTSFSIGTKLINKSIRQHIYSIYGFVRYADEIVDTFHGFDKKVLLERFKKDTYLAIEEGISLNPILNSFQFTVNKYKIDLDVIKAFLHSMEMDLSKESHDLKSYKEYIYGSAEVVGLMCLRVFVEGNFTNYEKLKPSALKLGSAFQKVNFLRDLNHDNVQLGRTYFPELEYESFNLCTKHRIEDDIEKDFRDAYIGIMQLPVTAKLGVYVAYMYYYNLFKKIQSTTPERIMNERVRIPDSKKIYLLTKSYFKYSLSMA
ncbi:MAG: phytoene/squalene synthase family protein [Cytophagales bacterium]|nr:MAG: phytoene/squalene synthase family protein [Cytophagales bacterium]